MTAYDEDMVREFRSEALERLEQVESSLLGIERGDAEAVARAFRALHTIKGNASFVDFVVVNRLAHQLEALLDRVRAGTMAAEQAVVDILLEGTDRLRRLVQAPPAGDGEAIDAVLARIAAVQTAAPPAAPPAAAPAAAAPARAPLPAPAVPPAAPAAGRRPRLGEWMIASGGVDPALVMAALIAQERMARHPLEILTGDAGVPIEAALAVCAEAEDIGLHPFAVAAARGSAGGWSTPRLHARLQASRPPIGRVISELGLLPPERMRELLATYFASVGATVPAPHPVVAPAATAAQPAPAAPAATPAAPAAAAAWEFPAPARLTIGPELQTELQEMTDSEARQGYEERILGLRGEPPLVPLLDQLYRDLHSLKGTFGFLGARLTQRVVHAMEDALSLCKRRGESLAAVDREALVDALLTGVDLVWRLRDACLRAGDEAGAGVHDGLAAWKADLDRACAALVAACDAHDAASGHDITSEF